MTKKIWMITAAFLLAATSVTAYAAEEAGNEIDLEEEFGEETDMEETEDDVAVMVELDGVWEEYPPFIYPASEGEEPLSAVCLYMTDNWKEKYLLEDVDATIPVLNQAGMYYNEDEDVCEIYGTFALYNFRVDEDAAILQMVSGGIEAGVFVVEADEDGQWHVSEEKTRMRPDGEDTGFFKEICEGKEGLLEAMEEVYVDQELQDEADAEYIRMYVEMFSLPLVGYSMGDEIIFLDMDDDYWTIDADSDNPVLEFAGDYYDEEGGMTAMFIQAYDTDSALIMIDRWDEEDEDVITEWVIFGTFDEEENTIFYEEAEKIIYTYSDEDDYEGSEETVYMDGTGSFEINDDGTITWTDDKEDAGNGCVFVFNEDDDEYDYGEEYEDFEEYDEDFDEDEDYEEFDEDEDYEEFEDLEEFDDFGEEYEEEEDSE